MRHFKQLTLATLFSLSAIFLLAGCGPTDGDGGPGGGKTHDAPGVSQPSCKTLGSCNDPNKECLSYNSTTQKGYCQTKCKDPAGNECGEGYKCAVYDNADPSKPKAACFKKCSNDKACGTGSICKSSVCVIQHCGDPTDQPCGPNRQCNPTMKVCEAVPSTTGPGEGPTTGKECTKSTQCGSGNIWSCNIPSGKTKGTCESMVLTNIVIQDLGTACDSGDKGSDIVGVAFLSSSKDIKGWARNVFSIYDGETNRPANGYYNPNKPDGQPPGYQEGKECAADHLSETDPNKVAFTSTGCRGYLAMQVSPTEGIAKGYVSVYEYDGKVCGKVKTPASEKDDSYNVYACPNTDYLTKSYSQLENYLTTNCVILNANPLSGYSESAYPPASTQE